MNIYLVHSANYQNILSDNVGSPCLNVENLDLLQLSPSKLLNKTPIPMVKTLMQSSKRL